MVKDARVDTFSDRINYLVNRDFRYLTNVALVGKLKESGCFISPSYLSQLRNGLRRTPSGAVVDALSNFFDVSPEFLYAVGAKINENNPAKSDDEIISAVIDPWVRGFLKNASGLSEESQELLIILSRRLRLSE